MVRRGKTQRRRRQRGGANPLKVFVLSMLGLLSVQQPAQGFPTWDQLKKPMSQEEIKKAAAQIINIGEQYRPPSLTGFLLPKVEQYVHAWNTELSESGAKKLTDETAYTTNDPLSWMQGKTLRIVGEDDEAEEYIVSVDGDEDPEGRYAVKKTSLVKKTAGGKHNKTLRRKK